MPGGIKSTCTSKDIIKIGRDRGKEKHPHKRSCNQHMYVFCLQYKKSEIEVKGTHTAYKDMGDLTQWKPKPTKGVKDRGCACNLSNVGNNYSRTKTLMHKLYSRKHHNGHLQADNEHPLLCIMHFICWYICITTLEYDKSVASALTIVTPATSSSISVNSLSTILSLHPSGKRRVAGTLLPSSARLL